MDNYNKNLIVVDNNDNIIGTVKALTGHHKSFLTLHRAFSLFLVDNENSLVLQKRSNDKLVFSGIWANTVCSHPFLNPLSFSDPILDAKNHLIKRLNYELGINNIKEEELQYIGRVWYMATDTKYFGHLLEGEPCAQEYKEFEIGENLQVEKYSKDFFEWEIDYIFVCKKTVDIVLNTEEVQDVTTVNKQKYNKMVENGLISKWTRIIVDKSNIFDILEKL